MKRNNIPLVVFLLAGFLIVLALPSILADLGTFKQNDCVQIKTILNSSNVNISTINYPNSSVIISNQEMTKSGMTFNYTFCNTSTLGVYTYDYFDYAGNTYVNSFEISYSGEEVTSEQIYIWIIGLIFLVGLIFGTGFIIHKLPSQDATDSEGSIVQISNLKYVRKFLWIFIWGISLAIVFILSNLSLAYIPNQLMGNFFFMLYRVMFWFTILGLPLSIVWLFYKVWEGKEFQKMINRGVDLKGAGFLK